MCFFVPDWGKIIEMGTNCPRNVYFEKKWDKISLARFALQEFRRRLPHFTLILSPFQREFKILGQSQISIYSLQEKNTSV